MFGPLTRLTVMLTRSVHYISISILLFILSSCIVQSEPDSSNEQFTWAQPTIGSKYFYDIERVDSSLSGIVTTKDSAEMVIGDTSTSKGKYEVRVSYLSGLGAHGFVYTDSMFYVIKPFTTTSEIALEFTLRSDRSRYYTTTDPVIRAYEEVLHFLGKDTWSFDGLPAIASKRESYDTTWAEQGSSPSITNELEIIKIIPRLGVIGQWMIDSTLESATSGRSVKRTRLTLRKAVK